MSIARRKCSDIEESFSEVSHRHGQLETQKRLLVLRSRPSRSFCADLARFANNSEAKVLRKLSRSVGPGEFPHKDEWAALSDQCPTYFDLMKEFSSAKMPLEQLLSILPLIKPRIYSIGSDARYCCLCCRLWYLPVPRDQWSWLDWKLVLLLSDPSCRSFCRRTSLVRFRMFEKEGVLTKLVGAFQQLRAILNIRLKSCRS
eukprot:s2538_g6.t2